MIFHFFMTFLLVSSIAPDKMLLSMVTHLGLEHLFCFKTFNVNVPWAILLLYV